jgi:hypothetical protein
MEIEREKFLADLGMVKSGLSAREFLEQSSCFVFMDGMVMTFNDEVACRKDINLGITGAVQAATLLAILEKITDKKLDVDENEKGELEFRGEKKRFGVTKDAEVFLPIDRVRMPKHWHDIPKGVVEAIGWVKHCVSLDESRFLLTCIHLHPDYVEACDNYQVMRVKIKTGLPGSVLVRGTSLAPIVGVQEGEGEADEETSRGLGMNQIAMTKSWLHFKNEEGLIYSCRRYVEDYPSLDKLIGVEGHPIVLSKGLKGASDCAAVFATDKSGDPLVGVKLNEGRITIRGEGLSGWYEEKRKVTYDGPPIEFFIAPDLLHHISEKYSDAQIRKDRLKVTGGGWEYVTVLGMKPTVSKKDES